jgi:hypothetical protein
MLAWAYPWLLLLVALYLFWKMLDIDKDIKALRKCGVDPIEEEPTRVHRKDQVEKNFKPGFRDDPEWQAKSAELRETISKNKKVNHIELNDDKYQRIPPYWTKKR